MRTGSKGGIGFALNGATRRPDSTSSFQAAKKSRQTGALPVRWYSVRVAYFGQQPDGELRRLDLEGTIGLDCPLAPRRVVLLLGVAQLVEHGLYRRPAEAPADDAAKSMGQVIRRLFT